MKRLTSKGFYVWRLIAVICSLGMKEYVDFLLFKKKAVCSHGAADKPAVHATRQLRASRSSPDDPSLTHLSLFLRVVPSRHITPFIMRAAQPQTHYSGKA